MSNIPITERVEQAAQDQFELVKLIMQLAMLEQHITPLMPAASKKLVSDLLESGCQPKRLGKVIGRSPGYVKSIAAGKASLSPAAFTKLVRHAVSSGATNASA